MSKPDIMTGLVTASSGHQYLVEAEHQSWQCVGRGKRLVVACGDIVTLTQSSQTQAVIERVLPRRNLLYRSVAHRSKLIAANVDQVMIVVAPEPACHELLLNRCLVAANAAGIATILCLNKNDLSSPFTQLQQKLSPYKPLVNHLAAVSAHGDFAALHPLLENKITVLVGQSGMGKSSLINALIPGCNNRIGEISHALDSGRHTTTGAHLHHMDANSHLIDSPGMQVFGLNHINSQQLDGLFPDFAPYLGQCRFSNCRHHHEPDCAVRNALKENKILSSRYNAYLDILHELDKHSAHR